MQYRDWFESPRRCQSEGASASLNPEYEWSEGVIAKRRPSDFSYIIDYFESRNVRPRLTDESLWCRTERETEMRRDRFQLIEVVDRYDIKGWQVNVWIRQRGTNS